LKRQLTKGETAAIQVMMAVFDAAEAYRRENIALRSILLKRGLSDAAIQGRVRRFLKKGEHDETAARLLKRVCEESLSQLRGIDLEKWLEEVQIEGKPH
jgi:hypothetical protein